MMSIECEEEVQASRRLSNMQQPEMNFSPQKHHSFNLPLKNKMAVQFASGIGKESLPHSLADHEMSL
jgi:hypothetical protein